jgi:magnesium chelatase subunit D
LYGTPALPPPRDAWRRKVRTKARRALIVLVVDASESMGAGERLRIAKAAALGLLRDAYLRRDRVALAVFEGESARVLLPATPSIALARERLQQIPLGGATPLAAGLVASWDLIRAERLRDPQVAPTLVLFSDGRANVPLDAAADPRAEALALCSLLRADGVSSLVVDAGSAGPTPPELKEIALRLGARLLRVGSGGAGLIVNAVRGA